MQIGELSARSGVSRDTLRFYEKRGLIQAHRRPNGYRHYPADTLFVLEYVRTAQRLGFTLLEIQAELPALTMSDSDGRLAIILQSKIATIDDRIAELSQLRDDLAKRVGTACPLRVQG